MNDKWTGAGWFDDMPGSGSEPPANPARNPHHDGYLEPIDLSKPVSGPAAARIQQFSTRKAAEEGARRIGWSKIDATEVEIMGFRLWVITDPHGNAVTRDGFVAWASRREA